VTTVRQLLNISSLGQHNIAPTQGLAVFGKLEDKKATSVPIAEIGPKP